MTKATDLQQVVKALEDDIIFGRMAPGARLVEDQLMDRFGATRHVVRSALQRLEQIGVVSKELNKGAAVRAFSIDEVRQVYEVRELLQRQAALKIKLPAPPALIAELEEIHQRYCRHIDDGHLRGIHEMNDLFHSRFFAACGNAYLFEEIKRFMWLTYAIRANNLAVPSLQRISRAHHALMIELLKGEDNWTLAQLCVDHIQPSKLAYIRSHEERAVAPAPALGLAVNQ